MAEKGSEREGVRKILVIRLGALGDVILTVPAQQLLGRLYPGARIDWLTEPPYIPFLSALPGIERVWQADTRAWRSLDSFPTDIFRLIRGLRSERYDLAVDFQGLLKSAILARLSGAAEIRGFGRRQAREWAAALLYSEPVTTAEGKRHQLLRHMDLAHPPRWDGLTDARFPCRIPTEAADYVRVQLGRLNVERPVLLNPGGGWSTKRWEPKRFAALAIRVEQELSLPTVFTLGPGEEELGSDIRAHLRGIPLRYFPTSILELAALCRESPLMVGGDTGPLHLAVAMGTPTVAVLGPAEPWRTGPFNAADRAILHDRPCPHPYRRRCRDHFCMDIPVDRVFDAVVGRLAG